MFSNQKKSFFKSKWFYGIIVLFLLAFGIWINYDGGSQKANTATNVDQETKSTVQSSDVVDSRDKETKETSDDLDKETTENTGETDKTGETQKAYYLIREIEGVVKVFYCNENGEESLYQITTIPFTLLSKEDQQLLAEGVHVDTKDELADFLENFDS